MNSVQDKNKQTDFVTRANLDRSLAEQQSSAVLQQEKQNALQQLNSAGSLIEVQKLTGKLHAIESSIQDTTTRINMAAQKTLVQ